MGSVQIEDCALCKIARGEDVEGWEILDRGERVIRAKDPSGKEAVFLAEHRYPGGSGVRMLMESVIGKFLEEDERTHLGHLMVRVIIPAHKGESKAFAGE